MAFETTTRSAVALDEVVRLSIPFVFGQSFEMGIWASVMTDTDNVGDSSRSVADFNPGLNWLGVQGAWVRETRFTTDLSIRSDSGVDWMQPVPEPSTTVLAALGALVLAWRLQARRRPQRRPSRQPCGRRSARSGRAPPRTGFRP